MNATPDPTRTDEDPAWEDVDTHPAWKFIGNILNAGRAAQSYGNTSGDNGWRLRVEAHFGVENVKAGRADGGVLHAFGLYVRKSAYEACGPMPDGEEFTEAMGKLALHLKRSGADGPEHA